MSRSGYVDDFDDPLAHGRWRQAVSRAITGKRGQAMLRDLITALDAMPEKELAADSLVTADGEYCTLGVLGKARGLDLTKLDPEDSEQVAEAFGIARAMACEIVYENDEQGFRYEERPWVKRWWSDHPPTYRVEETPEERWQRMRAWAVENLVGEGAKP